MHSHSVVEKTPSLFDLEISSLKDTVLPTPFQCIIHQSKYARWSDEKGRRETWFETVHRYISFFRERYEGKVNDELWVEAFKAILNLEVSPSMRALWAAGKALEKDEICNYNCSYLAVNHQRAFSEAFFLLLAGCFDKDQEIKTSTGNKKISTLTLDDEILTYEEESGIYYFTKPRAIFENNVEEIPKLKLTFSDGSEVICTENHKFLTQRGWVEAKDLYIIESFVENLSNSLVQKETIQTNEKTFWDVSIDKTHNYVLSNGVIVHNCGVGFSVERQEIAKLPEIPEEIFPSDSVIIVKDSKLGWVQALNELISLLYSGRVPKWDLKLVRPTGSRLKTFGGRASGPRPLDELFKTTVQTFKNARGRKLNSFECHNLMTSIAATVQVGGSRRCLFIETEVELENGQTIQIKDVKVGDKIQAGDGSITTITNIFDNGDQEVVRVYLSDGTYFECTEDHRWWVYNQDTTALNFVETKNLMSGKFWMVDTHNIVATKVISIEYTKEIKPVMDIEVSHPNHQFLAISSSGARGISHNSALISLSNLSDERMRDCKTGQWWEQNPNLSFANNSVAYTEKPDIGIFMKEWLSLYMSKSGERGIFNRQGAKKHIKEGGRRDPDHEFGLNPCVTGDTLVAVADGRGLVSIKTLAHQGRDVPVFCLDQEQKVTISTMVNPRKTGISERIWKIKFSTGDTVKVTDNHKFLTSDRIYKPVTDLKVGDALNITRKLSTENSWIWVNGDSAELEECLVASNIFDMVDPIQEHQISHKDNISKHNEWYNLEVVDSFTNKPLPFPQHIKNHILNHTFKLGKQLEEEDWIVYAKKNNLPEDITTISSQLKDFNQITKWAFEELEFARHVNTTWTTLVRYRNCLAEGYDCDLVDNRIIFHKVCEISGKPFDTFVKEQMIKTEFRDSIVYPTCVKKPSCDFSFEIVSITETTPEDVYSGTVKNFHNYLVGGFDEKGTRNQLFLNNLQCGEIVLRSKSLCNLTSVILRPSDKMEDVKRKMAIATFLGTIQSDMTNFRFLSKEWKKNCLEEHLLGVSLSGIMDHPFFSTLEKEVEGFNLPLPETLQELREFTFTENEKYAEMIGISPSVSTTAIKPEGNSSSLNNSSPGIHPRYSPYYIRSIRFDNHDSLAKMLKDQGVPCEPDVMKPETTTVFYFPIQSPENSIFVKDISALEQLELYKIYKTNYTTHNPSITVYVKENEWLEVGAWVYKNFDIISGVSFLPNVEHTYAQLPYQEVSEEVFKERLASFPEIDWTKLQKYESEDNTTGSMEYACVGGACALD